MSSIPASCSFNLHSFSDVTWLGSVFPCFTTFPILEPTCTASLGLLQRTRGTKRSGSRNVSQGIVNSFVGVSQLLGQFWSLRPHARSSVQNSHNLMGLLRQEPQSGVPSTFYEYIYIYIIINICIYIYIYTEHFTISPWRQLSRIMQLFPS